LWRDQEIVIVPGRTEQQYLRDIWNFRELLIFLSWRDILVRYKQTTFGVCWAFLRPFITMITFTFVFGRLAKMQAPDDLPYPVLVLIGTVVWQLLSTALTLASQSLTTNASMITKIYFPRIIIPLSAMASPLVDFFINLVFLSTVMVYYRVVPSWNIVFLPFFFLLAILTAIGIGLWLGALTVRYRDFREVIPFLVQFGLFLSPVGYLSNVLPDKSRMLYSLNPVVGVIDGFRWCFLGQKVGFFPAGFLISTTVTFLVLAIGIRYFRNVERTFADVI